jgi:hypothetical protein
LAGERLAEQPARQPVASHSIQSLYSVNKMLMASNKTKAGLKVIAELLIVFAGAVGVIGMFLDYSWITETNIITDEKIILKYFSGLLVAIAHGVVMLLRNSKNNHNASGN